MLVLLVFIVVAYIVYRLFFFRIRARWLRVLLSLPTFLLVLFSVALVAVLSSQDTQLTPERIAEQVVDRLIVQRDDLIVSVSAAGTIQPARQVPLTFAFNAPVIELMVEEGQVVEDGQMLARLDATDLQQLLSDAEIALSLQRSAFDALTAAPREVDVAAAQAALDAARAQWGAASLSGPSQSELEIARLQTEIARNRLWQSQLARDSISSPQLLDAISVPLPPDTPPEVSEPVQDLEDLANDLIGATNAQSLAGIEAQRNQAIRAIEQVEFGVQIADTNFETTASRGADPGSLAAANAQRIQAEIALQRLLNGPTEMQLQQARIEFDLAELALEQSRLSLEQAELRAPFSGVVGQLNLSLGELPPQGVAVLLLDDTTLYVDLPIDETDIAWVSVGQRVVLEVDALPNMPVEGEVVRVSLTPLQAGQLVTYISRVEITQSEVPLRVGMSVTARVITLERDDVLIVPNRFIRIDRATQDAFVVLETAPGVFEERMILIGERNDTDTEVRSGLEPGQQLVLLPASLLEDNRVVRRGSAAPS